MFFATKRNDGKAKFRKKKLQKKFDKRRKPCNNGEYEQPVAQF